MFWVQIRPHLWSFGFKGLPIDQHFTFAKNSKSGINFHITKNKIDPENHNKKPFIPILEIDKEIVSSDVNSLFLTMIFGMLNEINIKEFQKNSNLMFLSFNDLNKDNHYGENDKDFFNAFKEVSKIERKTRLKVNEGWDDKFAELIQSKKMIKHAIQSIKKSEYLQPKDIDSGVLIIDRKVLSVIKIFDKWYELTMEKKPIEMFKQVIDEKLARFIWYKIRRSIIILKSVNSWRDTENKYRPITIVKNT